MDRSLPTSANKLLQKLWDEKNQVIHKQKIKNIKSRIDQKSPYRYAHVFKNSKKEQILEGKDYSDRYTEIERENRILLEKMSQIIQTRSNSMSKVNKFQMINESKRKKSLEKLVSDNSFFVKRLKKQSSFYSLAKFEEERKEQEGYLHRISEFPYRLGSSRKGVRSAVSGTRTASNKIVFMKSVIITEKKFDVEIYKNKRQLIIMAFDSSEMYKLVFSLAEAYEIMKDETSYEELLSKLKYENQNLLLVD